MRQKMSKNKVIKKKSKKVNFIYVIMFMFCFYFTYTIFDQQIKINKYNSQIEMYEKDIKSKNNLVEFYSKQSKNIQSDEYIESVARDKLGYVKPYEKIFVDANR